MTDFLLQFAVSNLCVSLGLALVAWAVHATGKQPLVAYLMWLLVLAKLITPPIATVPLVPVPGLASDTELGVTPTGMLIGGPNGAAVFPTRGADAAIATVNFVEYAKTGLVLLWVLGSVCVFAWSLVRICRFHHLLNIASEVAPPELQRTASQIAHRLGLRVTSTIYTTSASVSPMVWWLGRGVRIVIPGALLEETGATELRWILAHELAHVRRRDHLVRWLEWIACICFWWNPLAWWARRNLRINEEICCDALVLSRLEPKPKAYASALMTVIEYLASPVIRPPAMASEMNSGGFLARRLEMIVSRQPAARTPRWMRVSTLLLGLILLPLGVAYAQDDEAGIKQSSSKADMEAVKDRIGTAIESGRITEEEGEARWHAYEARLIAEHLEEVWAELQAEVEAGTITAEEAEARMAAIKEAKHGGDREKGIWRRVAGVLMESGVEREQVRQVLRVVKEIAAEIKTEGDAFELDPAAKEQLIGMSLTDEQIELSLRIARRIAGHWARQAREEALWDRVAGALNEAGIEESKQEDIMGAIKRIAHEVNEEGEEFEVDPAVLDYLIALELTDEQIELVIDLSRRVAASSDDDRGRDGMVRRIAGALIENGIPREQVRAVMELLRPIVGEIREEGNDFLLDPATHDELVGMGLTAEQIDFVVGIAQRLAHHRTNAERGKGRHVDWDAIKQRIEAAVERGDLTREEADAKYEEYGRIKQRN